MAVAQMAAKKEASPPSQPSLIFGEDYGTSEYKFGPSTLGNIPDLVENRGYFPDSRSSLLTASAKMKGSMLVVGPEVSNFVEAKRDIAERMVYPMRAGGIEVDDNRSWAVVKEITRYGLLRHLPKRPGFQGVNAVAALSASSPRYMYEKLIDLHKEINREEGKLVRAVSIIPQPFAVAIAQKKLSCTVIEAGHGNTQVAPISAGVIFSALITLQRGGGDCDVLTAEILKDAGYGDLAREPKLVKLFKEAVGLVPKSLKEVMKKQGDKDFAITFKIPNTKISIELGKNSWQRFLIGEYFFDPSNDVFTSYYRRGFAKPLDAQSEGKVVPGTTSLSDVIAMAVGKVSFEIQPALYQNILLSGGNFAWKVPENLAGTAVDSPTKLRLMLDAAGIQNVNVTTTENPVYNVWQGCVTYGMYIPSDYVWDWEAREGWMYLDEP